MEKFDPEALLARIVAILEGAETTEEGSEAAAERDLKAYDAIVEVLREAKLI